MVHMYTLGYDHQKHHLHDQQLARICYQQPTSMDTQPSDEYKYDSTHLQLVLCVCEVCESKMDDINKPIGSTDIAISLNPL